MLVFLLFGKGLISQIHWTLNPMTSSRGTVIEMSPELRPVSELDRTNPDEIDVLLSLILFNHKQLFWVIDVNVA